MTSTATTDTFDITGLGMVHRLGFGAMRITGPGIWGEPADRRSPAAWFGGPSNSVSISSTPPIPMARRSPKRSSPRPLHPYPDGLRIATKGGLTRPGRTCWSPVGRPEYLRQEAK